MTSRTTETSRQTTEPGGHKHVGSNDLLGSNLIRVFPRRTNATPDDDRAVTGTPRFWDKAENVHVSVAFSWDIPKAERLAKEWERVGHVTLGGPAIGTRGEQFEPGVYVKRGYVITSRGCPNKCWFCSVWKREGPVRELEIKDGWNVLDDNLLACSEQHVRKVFAMLRRQRRPIEFTGGWEAARLRDWHVDQLLSLRLESVFFAYDTADDYEPLVAAGRKLESAGLSKTRTGNVSHRMRCYCLVGYPKDTMSAAEQRLRDTYEAGFIPMAMLWRDQAGKTTSDWRRFQKCWARPASVNRMCRDGTPAA